MRIAILGPCSAAALIDHLDVSSKAEALDSGDDSYGPPVNALVLALLDAGHRVDVITHRRGKGALRLHGPRLTFEQVASRSSAARQGLTWFRSERRAMLVALAKCQPEVVNAHWTYEWALTALAYQANAIITIHDSPWRVLRANLHPYWLLRVIMACVVRLRSVRATFVAVSPYVAEQWRRKFFWRGLIRVIPNLTQSSNAARKSGERRKPGVLGTEARIIEIANASRLKNVRGLVSAFDLLSIKRPNDKLILVGPGLGPDEETARWSMQFRCADRIEFRGIQSHEEVMTALASSTVHAHASLEESYGMSIAEALAHGVPVVAARGGGGTDWLLRDGGGLLVDVQNAQEFADAICYVIDATQASDHLRDEALFASRKFGASSIVDQYVSIYESTVVGTSSETWYG
ncbi:glycosyltransferase family 4 protein [Sinomonas atrocyanea]